MNQHSENYRFYLYLTRENFRINAKKYEQYLNEKQYVDSSNNNKTKKPVRIKRTVTP
jgi:hypothetical protein